jgi:hypothetical protein
MGFLCVSADKINIPILENYALNLVHELEKSVRFSDLEQKFQHLSIRKARHKRANPWEEI